MERAKDVKRAEVVKEIVEGAIDQRGQKVLDVYWSMKDYAIYRVKSGVFVQFSDDARVAGEQRRAYGEIGSLLSDVECLQFGRMSAKKLKSTEQQIARAIALTLDGNIHNAKATLTAVQKELSNLQNARAQLQHQVGGFSVVIGAMIVVNFYIGDGGFFYPDDCLPNSEIRPRIITYGAIGGFLSILMGRKNQFDIVNSNFGWLVNVLGGASRIIIAMIGSVLVYLIIQSDLLGIQILNDVKNNCHATYMVSMIAGFSETFVPSFLQRSIDKVSTVDKEKTKVSTADKEKTSEKGANS